MKRKYEDLILATAKFSEDWWLPFEDSIGLLETAIINNIINKEKLNSDFQQAIADKDFDWINFAKESQLLITPEVYSNIEIENYIKLLLHDYLIPEKMIDSELLESLNKEVENILQEHSLDDGWMFSYDLFDVLKKQQQFKNLEYYNLWKLPFIRKRIEQKYIENKEREIGYLRFNYNL